MNLFIKKYLILILSLLMLTLPHLVQAREKSLPFFPGEKLVFQLKWGFIPAGKAIMEILPQTTIEGKDAWHFSFTAKSNAFVDSIYKVRDRIDAFADISMNQSLFYKKNQREGKTRRDITVSFDNENHTVEYQNFNKKNPPLSIMPGAFDPLSAFYYIRGLTMGNDSVVERAITDGKKCVVGTLVVVKRETIKIKSGTYDTWLIEPNLKHVGGVFKKSKNAKLQLWVTADDRRIPVRIKSRVVVGSFVGELIGLQEGKKSEKNLLASMK